MRIPIRFALVVFASILLGALAVSSSHRPSQPTRVVASASSVGAAVVLSDITTTSEAPTTAPPTTEPPTTTAPAPVRRRATTPTTASAPTTEPAEPPAEQAPAPTGSSALDAIATYFGDVYDKAVRVARCESGLNPSAVSSGGGNWGLFQINSVHKANFEAVTGQPWSAVLDASANAQYARHLYDSSGWGPWTCRGA